MARIVHDDPDVNGTLDRARRARVTANTRGRRWVVGAAALAAILLHAPAHAAGTADLHRIVVIGDSVLAGFASGGLVARGRMGQRDAAPALIARQAHVSLRQPLMTQPGFPPPLQIVDANRNGVLDPGEVRRRSGGIGFRSQPGRAARNLAVPGESVASVAETIGITDVIGDAIGGSVSGRDVMKVVILDLPPQDEAVSQLRRARDIGPSFLLVWLGNNDVLGAVSRTDPTAIGSTPTQFGTKYRAMLDALADTGAPMAVANIPDVTRLPVLRRAAGDVTTCRAADGSMRSVAADDLLSIRLPRSALPVPGCGRVLDAGERASIRQTIVAFDAEIAAAAADVEMRRGVPVALVDTFALFDGFDANGVDVRGDGSLVLTSRYLGGLFTLDGVHPDRTAHALVANAFIDAMNARFASAIPRVDVAAVAAKDPFVGNRFQPSSEPSFGLIDNDEDVLDDAADTIVDHIDDVLDDLKDRFEDLF